MTNNLQTSCLSLKQPLDGNTKSEFPILFVRNDGVIYPTGINFEHPILSSSSISTELIKRNVAFNYLSSQSTNSQNLPVIQHINQENYLPNSSRFHPYQL